MDMKIFEQWEGCMVPANRLDVAIALESRVCCNGPGCIGCGIIRDLISAGF